ncbi:PKD domain-containing protein [Natrinema marinum]|uniref:PKD domain-containing protein n=1 Tax=Natrinema marinum TaxID=2961598 RepID=UPI0020C91136|nr:PKD domain-containing protein [Natrinema marinum]
MEFDATDSQNAIRVGYDFDGDERIDENTTDGEAHIASTRYTDTGVYYPLVVAEDEQGSVDWTGCEAINVTENGIPTATFEHDPGSPETGEPVTFDASASSDPDGAIVEYRWDFDGDGTVDNTTTNPTITHTYSTDGTRLVTLTVIDDAGAQASAENYVAAYPPGPTAVCSVSPTTARIGEPVTIDARNSTNAAWVDFDYEGDGTWNTTTYEAPHVATTTYDEVGEYTPRIRVWDRYERDDETACSAVTVTDNAAPTATFEYTPDNPGIDEEVTFDASASSDPDGSIVEYRWDIDGDGTVDNTTTNPTVTYTYTDPGTKTVSVTVVDDDGTTDDAERSVFVSAPGPVAVCSVSRTSIAPGESVTIDASASENATWADIDYYGDGTWNERFSEQFGFEKQYDEPGEYEPRVRVWNQMEASDETPCGSIIVQENQPPSASLASDPAQPDAGDSVTFDASASSDPDGSIVEYRWDIDGDGTVDNTTTGPELTTSYDAAGGVVAVVTVVDDDGATASASADVSVATPPPLATCTLSASTVGPNETIVVDAGGSDAAFVRFDLDGDGEYDVTDETDFRTEISYEESGTYQPRVLAVRGDRTDETTCGNVTIAGSGPISEVPILPVAGGIGALGIAGLLWWLWPIGGTPAPAPTPGGGGSGGDGSSGSPKPKPKPKPKPTPPKTRAYDAGVVTVPSTSGPVSVTDVGFEPDLLVFSATNAAREDGATDRTAGWTTGVAVRTADGFDQQAVTVADDAAAIDGATCATTTDDAFALVRHDDRLPGRVRGRVIETTDSGFDLEVAVPARDPAAAGIRVVYRAFRFDDDVSASVGHFLTPTEPGIQTVDLGIDADHVMLAGTSAVGDADRTFTTDRAVGLSVGTATGRDNPTQTCWSGAAWPGPEATLASGGSRDHALEIAYLEGDRLAGTTTAAAVGLGERLQLRYDRVYSGPNKLGSVARHVVTYVALETGDEMTPVTGAVRLPEPGESISIGCGFEPGLVEVDVAGATALDGPSPTSAATMPFGWSTGAAVVRDGQLEQYALHAAIGGRTPLSAAGAGGVRAATDGGISTGRTAVAAAETASHSASVPAGELEIGNARADGTDALGQDGVVGAWLSPDDGGAVAGRDELAVAITETGFDIDVAGVRVHDHDSSGGPRPYVWYRAWPAAESAGNEETETNAETDMSEHETDTDPRTNAASDQTTADGSRRGDR